MLRAAIGESGLVDGRVLPGLDAFLGGSTEGTKAAEAVEDLDEAAFDAQEAGDEARYLMLWRQARAASAVVAALEGDTLDALYESAHALNDPDDVIATIG